MINGKTLLHPPVNDILEMGVRVDGASVRTLLVNFLSVHAPVGVTKIKERSPILIDEVLFTRLRLHEAMLVDGQIAIVPNASQTSLNTVQGFIFPAG